LVNVFDCRNIALQCITWYRYVGTEARRTDILLNNWLKSFNGTNFGLFNMTPKRSNGYTLYMGLNDLRIMVFSYQTHKEFRFKNGAWGERNRLFKTLRLYQLSIGSGSFYEPRVDLSHKTIPNIILNLSKCILE